MPLSNELQMTHGVKTIDELFCRKTDAETKQNSFSVSETSPYLVGMTEGECRKLCDKVGFDFRTGYEKRIIRRITTTETPDRDGDIVRARGIDNTEYRKEPIVLYSHDRCSFPVGRSLKEWIDKDVNGWLSFDMYFADDIDTTGKSDAVFRFVASGAMRGASIGFLPLESRHDFSKEERTAMGLGAYGVEYIRIRKLEHSVCSVPANQEALANMIKSIDKTKLSSCIRREDLDLFDKNSMLDGNIIDMFYSILGIEKTISIPGAGIGHEVLKPYPNEHACRLNDPGKYEDFRRGKRKHDGKEYSVIFGKLKKKNVWEEQAYRYPKDTWDADDAKKHCGDNDGSFEAAKGEKVYLDNDGILIMKESGVWELEEKNIRSVVPPSSPSPVINVNLNVEKIAAELKTMGEEIKTLQDKISTVSFDDISVRINSLIAAAEKAVSAIERESEPGRLYDTKEIEDLLKL
jgi:phage head maturation protease